MQIMQSENEDEILMTNAKGAKCARTTDGKKGERNDCTYVPVCSYERAEDARKARALRASSAVVGAQKAHTISETPTDPAGARSPYYYSDDLFWTVRHPAYYVFPLFRVSRYAF
jgi:hypothetical protein